VKSDSNHIGRIHREPAAAATFYDLIIVGGGIYGVMLSLEASLRGLRSLILERDDFGGATTFNNLRILHGGLRYLQNMDLRRFRESVGERHWFLQNFPDLVEPLPCVMPLYGDGLKRSSIFRVALWANDLLSHTRRQLSYPNRNLPHGQVIGPVTMREIFPAVDTRGLQAGAVWYDAFMPDSQRLVLETLRWACSQGATVLNYVEAQQLLKTKNGVAGVLAIDRETGKAWEYRAKVVVNAAGPWCRELAARFDRDEPRLFRSSLAWNVLLKRKALSDHAVAVAPKKPGGHAYFLLPWKGTLLAGTGHALWYGSPENPNPSEDQLQKFLNDLNLAVPGLEADQDDILRVFSGLLPATRELSVDLTSREVILNHADLGGPAGLYSISGVKFTTSRLVAEKTLKQLFPAKKYTEVTPSGRCNPFQGTTGKRGIYDLSTYAYRENEAWKGDLRSLVSEESVQHLDDLILRRTNLWENPAKALELAALLVEFFDWNESRSSEEIERLRQALINGGKDESYEGKIEPGERFTAKPAD